MDLESRRRWEDYTRAKETMIERTHIPEAPWWKALWHLAWLSASRCFDHCLLKQWAGQPSH
jgi:polyphosphate kinase